MLIEQEQEIDNECKLDDEEDKMMNVDDILTDKSCYFHVYNQQDKECRYIHKHHEY